MNAPSPGPRPTGARGFVQRFAVSFAYPVIFSRGVFAPDSRVLAELLCPQADEPARRVAVALDSGLAEARPELADAMAFHLGALAGERLELAGPPLLVPGGERAKNDPDLPVRLLAWLHRLGLDRHSFLLIVGGGAVLDAAGFAGAVFHRGLRVVRLPSTVLAQDDSGIGVKNGVNAFGVKNLAGTFAPPWAVVADLDFLDSLPPRERVAGMAEAVKVAAIRDAAFFAWLEDNARPLAEFRPGPVETLVRRSAELHLAHIAGAGDPFESGSARPLDFGHWAAHKLESLSGNEVRHGEAVAIGMALDTRCSVESGLLAGTAGARVMRLLEALGFRLWHPALEMRDGLGRRRVVEGLEEFRAHLGGRLTVTLLEAIGRGREVGVLDPAHIERAIAWLAARENVR